MHFSTFATVLSTVAMGVAAVAVEKRLPRLGQFGVSLTRACPLQTPLDVFEFAEGEQSDACRTFLNNNVYRAIDVFFWDPQCLLTLFETNNCTDPGVVTGPNCWTPDGGIAAYKVTCPYKTS